MPQTKIADNNLTIEERNKLVEDNIGLVYHFAGKICKDGRLYDDCVQEGCLGLMRAARLYDSSRNNKFSTFAGFEIQCAIRDYIWNTKGYLKLPDAQRSAINAMDTEIRKLETEFGDVSENEKLDIANKHGISRDTYNTLACGVTSLNSVIESDDNSSEFGDTVDSGYRIESDYISRESYDNLVEMMTEFFENEVASRSADEQMIKYIKARLNNFLKSAQGNPSLSALEQMRAFHPELCATVEDSPEVKKQKARDLDRIYCKVSAVWNTGIKKFRENLQMIDMINSLREEIM